MIHRWAWRPAAQVYVHRLERDVDDGPNHGRAPGAQAIAADQRLSQPLRSHLRRAMKRARLAPSSAVRGDASSVMQRFADLLGLGGPPVWELVDRRGVG